jgi:hypothetical protein
MMNFGNLGGIGLAAGNFLATPEGQEAAKKFLASPDGVTLLKSFAGTPDGQKIIMNLLPTIVDGLDLPPAVKEMIKAAAH